MLIQLCMKEFVMLKLEKNTYIVVFYGQYINAQFFCAFGHGLSEWLCLKLLFIITLEIFIIYMHISKWFLT